MRTGEAGRSVGSRLLAVLFAFEACRGRMTLAELTRATGLPHATVRRLVAELVKAGALDRAPDDTFGVGIRLWQLGSHIPLSSTIRAAALPFMSDLHTALRQHVQLAVIDGTDALLVERISAGNAIDLLVTAGERLPLHSSGVGKILLAHADPDLMEEVLGGPLKALTSRTLTDPRLLRVALSDCRRSGIAEVREETSIGADSVATRVMDAAGTTVAAVSVVVEAGSVDLRTVRPAVIAAGLAISRRLGWDRPGR